MATPPENSPMTDEAMSAFIRMIRDTPVITGSLTGRSIFTVLPNNDRVLGIVRNNAVPPNTIIGVDPARGPDSAVAVAIEPPRSPSPQGQRVGRVLRTAVQATEAQRLLDGTMQQLQQQNPGAEAVQDSLVIDVELDREAFLENFEGQIGAALADIDFASLERRAAAYILDGDIVMDGYHRGMASALGLMARDQGGLSLYSLKHRNAPAVPPKGSLKKLPTNKAPLGMIYAAIQIEQQTHIIGTVPALGSLAGEAGRTVMFPVEPVMEFKNNRPHHAIPQKSGVPGLVVVLENIVEHRKGVRATALHDEWNGDARVVVFRTAMAAKSVKGFKAIKK